MITEYDKRHLKKLGEYSTQDEYSGLDCADDDDSDREKWKKREEKKEEIEPLN